MTLRHIAAGEVDGGGVVEEILEGSKRLEAYRD
jgi:hypothetical protein